MKARPPTMREKKRYILARINPPVPDPDPKELYFAVLESVTSLFGDAQTARMMPVVISCGKGYALIRCTRGYEEQTRIALMTLTSVAERKIALHPRVKRLICWKKELKVRNYCFSHRMILRNYNAATGISDGIRPGDHGFQSGWPPLSGRVRS
ncbi:MAG: hypothetical protein MUE45_07585 [Methanoregulaceae archaeon]|nr:hypothetical protein [Methanoregulaceae archaeon]